MFVTAHVHPLAAVTSTLPLPPFPANDLLFAESVKVFTVKVAAAVADEPHWLVNTARYIFPLRAAVTDVRVSDMLLAPAMSEKLEPPSVLSCHCTFEALVADAVKVALPPSQTVRLTGSDVTSGASSTTKPAGSDVAGGLHEPLTITS
jgi:hypothetical protein